MNVNIFISGISAIAFSVIGISNAYSESAKDALPEKFKTAGTLKVGHVQPYIPYIWKDESTGELTGFEVDVGRALGERLGVKWDITETKWEGLITGVGAERFDVGGSGASDLPERQKVVTFIDYSVDTSAVAILAANKDKFPTVDALCGQSVGTLKGTTTAELGNRLSEDCVAKKLEPMKINLYTSIPDADLAMKSGRDAAQIVGSRQALYEIKTGGQPWAIVQDGYDPIPTGFYVSNKQPELANAILLAAKELYADGTMKTLMAKYGLETSILEPAINAGATN